MQVVPARVMILTVFILSALSLLVASDERAGTMAEYGEAAERVPAAGLRFF